MIVNRADFLAALESLSAGLSEKGALQQSECFCFSNGRVYTYNGDTACSCPSALQGVQGAVPAAPLLNLLRKFPEEDLDIGSDDGAELQIKGKKRSAGIALDQKIHLEIDKIEMPEVWTSLPPEFPDALKIVRQCVSKDSKNKFVLSCVHFTPTFVEACDDVQGARVPLETGLTGSVLVRGESVKSGAELEFIEMADSESWLHFRNANDVTLSVRRHTADEYPNIDKFFEIENASPVQLPKGLAEAADRCAVFSEENKDDDSILVELRPGKIRVKGVGSAGWMSEVKSVTYSGEPLTFTISPKLLAEIVKNHNDALITTEKIKVDGAGFSYFSCLGDAS